MDGYGRRGGVVTVAGDVWTLTESEREKVLQHSRPHDTLEAIQRDWGLGVLRRPSVERPVLILAKLEVLEGFWKDPHAWVERALALASEPGAELVALEPFRRRAADHAD